MRMVTDRGDLPGQRVPGSRVGALMRAGELDHNWAPQRAAPAEPGFAPGALTQAFPGDNAVDHDLTLPKSPHRVTVVADGLLLHGALLLGRGELNFLVDVVTGDL